MLTGDQLNRLDSGTATLMDQMAAAARLRQDIQALRAIVQVLDGSQPIDVPGALMVARYWLGDI
jgi:hypothetical protein